MKTGCYEFFLLGNMAAKSMGSKRFYKYHIAEIYLFSLPLLANTLQESLYIDFAG